MSKETLSADSIVEANRSRANFSGHGNAKGAAGYKVVSDNPNCEFLSQSGQSTVINPREDGYGTIKIGAAWDNTQIDNAGFIARLIDHCRT